MCYDSCVYVPWRIHTCAVTRSCVCHDSFVCVPWLVHIYAMAHSHVCHDAVVRVPWSILMCAITCSSVCHGSFVCVPWLERIHAMAHSYVCNDALVRVPWSIRTCAVAHLYVFHDSFIHILRIVHLCLLRLIHWFMCAATWVSIHWTFLCVSWLIHSYTANRPFVLTSSHPSIHVCCDSGIHISDISMCVMTHSFIYWDFFIRVCHDAFIHLCVPWLVLSYVGHLAFVHDHDSPLTEEIRLKMFGFPDLPDFRGFEW